MKLMNVGVSKTSQSFLKLCFQKNTSNGTKLKIANPQIKSAELIITTQRQYEMLSPYQEMQLSVESGVKTGLRTHEKEQTIGRQQLRAGSFEQQPRTHRSPRNIPLHFKSVASVTGWGCGTGGLAILSRFLLGVARDMDTVLLTLTAALLCLTKTAAAAAGEATAAAAAAGEELSVNEAERFGEQEAATTDGQDPLALKQSVFIVTPIVMVR